MSYKQPPDNSIEGAGGLEPYVNRYYQKNNLPYTYGDLLKYFNNEDVTLTRRAKRTGVSRNTFKSWQARYNMEHETSTH